MAKKRNKTKVPKRIAGVKVPKPLRRGIRQLAASQTGRTVLVEALSVAAAALAATQFAPNSPTRRALRTQGPKAKAATLAAGAKTAAVATGVGAAFEEAARVFTATLLNRSTAAEPEVTPGAPH